MTIHLELGQHRLGWLIMLGKIGMLPKHITIHLTGIVKVLRKVVSVILRVVASPVLGFLRKRLPAYQLFQHLWR